MGVGRGVQGDEAPFEFKTISKKRLFFSISRGEKQISPILASPCKKFWDNPLLALPGTNPSDAHACSVSVILVHKLPLQEIKSIDRN